MEYASVRVEQLKENVKMLSRNVLLCSTSQHTQLALVCSTKTNQSACIYTKRRYAWTFPFGTNYHEYHVAFKTAATISNTIWMHKMLQIHPSVVESSKFFEFWQLQIKR